MSATEVSPRAFLEDTDAERHQLRLALVDAVCHIWDEISDSEGWWDDQAATLKRICPPLGINVIVTTDTAGGYTEDGDPAIKLEPSCYAVRAALMRLHT